MTRARALLALLLASLAVAACLPKPGPREGTGGGHTSSTSSTGSTGGASSSSSSSTTSTTASSSSTGIGGFGGGAGGSSALGACSDASDMAQIMEIGVPMAQADAIMCAAENDEATEPDTKACLTAMWTQITMACVTCFDLYAQCAEASCSEPCNPNFTSTACATCIDLDCTAMFNECSGLDAM
jgi:hypothetical protein